MARLGLRAWPHSRECKAFHPEGTDQPWPPGGGGSPASSPVSWMPEAGRGLGPAGFACRVHLPTFLIHFREEGPGPKEEKQTKLSSFETGWCFCIAAGWRGNEGVSMVTNYSL